MIAAAPVERMDVLQGTQNRWGRLAQLTLAARVPQPDVRLYRRAINAERHRSKTRCTLASRYGAPYQQNDYCSHYRTDQTGTFVRTVPAQGLAQPRSYERADNPEDSCEDKARGLVAPGRNKLCDHSGDEADHDCPNNVGGLNRSTQHFILNGKDGVCGDQSKLSSRFQCGRENGVMGSLATGRVAESDWASIW